MRLNKNKKPPIKRNILSIQEKLFIQVLPSFVGDEDEENSDEEEIEEIQNEWKSLRVHPVLPRTDFYKNLMSNTNEPLLYNIDILLTKDNNSKAGSTHHIVINYVINDIDRVNLNLGPVIGHVTKTTAKIMLEVNMNLRELVCEVKSKTDVLKEQAKAARQKQILELKRNEEERLKSEVERPKSRAELRAQRRGNLMSKPR